MSLLYEKDIEIEGRVYVERCHREESPQGEMLTFDWVHEATAQMLIPWQIDTLYGVTLKPGSTPEGWQPPSPEEIEALAVQYRALNGIIPLAPA